MKYYDNEIIERGGLKFRVSFPYDDCADLPWEQGDCNGVVTEWTNRAKKPCERILNSDRTLHRYYDVQASMKKAVDVWGCEKGEDAAKAVDADFEYLRQFCNNQWHYIVVCVDRLSEDGQVLSSDALGSVEDSNDAYVESITDEMIDSMLANYQTELLTQYSLDHVIQSMVQS